jgi:gliding motility-associated-like protein/uncharacterized repeat protein (TIGR01451 family)
MWARSMKVQDQGRVRTLDVARDAIGNVLITGEFSGKVIFGYGQVNQITINGSINDQIFIAKYNSNGELVWARNVISSGFFSRGNSIGVDKAGNCYVTGEFSQSATFGSNEPSQTTLSGCNETIFVAKYDKNGNFKWARKAGLLCYGNSSKGIAVDDLGNSVITGYFSGRSIFGEGQPQETELNPLTSGTWEEVLYVAKYSSEGILLWAKSSSPVNGIAHHYSTSVAMDKEGNSYITGYFNGPIIFGKGQINETTVTSTSYNDIFIAKYNNSGEVLWVKNIGSNESTYNRGNGITMMDNGDFCLTGRLDGLVTFGKGEPGETKLGNPSSVFIARYHSSGKLVWVKEIGGFGDNAGNSIVVDAYDNCYIAGHFEGSLGNQDTNIQSAGEKDIFIALFKPDGKLVGIRSAGGRLNDVATGIVVDPVGNCYLSGYIQDSVTFSDLTTLAAKNQDGFLAALSAASFLPKPNIIRGRVYQDSTLNCKYETVEKGLPDILIKAEPGPYYASTDKSGNYALKVDTGTYTISQLLPVHLKSAIFPSCNEQTYHVSFNEYQKDTASFDFANIVTNRQFLTVNIAANRRRRCFQNQMTIHYSNEGSASADGVVVKVVYPEFVIPISSSVPWNSKNGDTLIFDIGNLRVNTSGTIILTDSVTCGDETIRGLTQCVKAYITPTNNADKQNPQWDKSSIELNAKCKDNGFVKLVLRNIGKGNMADSTYYRIFLDARQVFEAKYKLNSHDSLVLEVPANGRTVRLEADQRPYHPGHSRPNITIEGCGNNDNVLISKGFFDQLPQDDVDDQVSISCLPILDSFDPNDKQASPAGVSDQRIIRKDEEIEYLIRFQNTGTDIAYKVIIQDTISPYLDISTLRVGAASHPFTWKVSGSGNPIITWIFDPINLPDSSSNELLSHGFVRFKIAQKKENTDGTKIINQAAIYFDYNSPVVTNQSVHMVGQLPIEISSFAINICNGTAPSNAWAGENTIIYEIDTFQLRASTPQKGIGFWRVIKGKASISNINDPNALLTNIGIGKNILEWTVTLCDQVSSSLVELERIVIPLKPFVENPAAYCYGEPILPLQAYGQNIEWFADATLQNVISKGDVYQVQISQTDTFYVTQTLVGYRSKAHMVIVTILPRAEAPIVTQEVLYCPYDKAVTLTAVGDNLRWYNELSPGKLLKEGPFIEVKPSVDTIYYVTQTNNGCESQPAFIVLKAGTMHAEEVYIPNVITPNSDGINDAFNQPFIDQNICIGNFQKVQIYNRWGKVVFESDKENFAWAASGHPSGIYYFTIRYSGHTFTSSLSVLR